VNPPRLFHTSLVNLAVGVFAFTLVALLHGQTGAQKAHGKQNCHNGQYDFVSHFFGFLLNLNSTSLAFESL
jgi:hypothetical protein